MTDDSMQGQSSGVKVQDPLSTSTVVEEADPQSQSSPPDVSQTPDPAVDQVIQQGLDLNTTLVQESAPQATPTDQLKTEGGKSPLDLLEEILEKEKGADPAVPTKSAEEIAAEQQRREEENKAALEAHRQKLSQEIQTPEQQQRDEVRKQQAQDLAHQNPGHIPQLQRSKIWVEEK